MDDKRVALFAFRGDRSCFVHVLLNALDLHSRGYEVKVVIEGAATGLVPELAVADPPLGVLYGRVRDEGLLDCVCQACAHQHGTLEAAREQGLGTCAEMSGHPSVGRYMDEGYAVVTF